MCGSYFDNFLMSSLNGAITFVQVNDISLGIAENLNLNMTGLLQVSFDEKCSIAKRCSSFGSGRLELSIDFVLRRKF